MAEQEATPVERVQILDTEETVAVVASKSAPTFESASGKSTLLATTGGRFVPAGKLPNGDDLEVQFSFRIVQPKAPRRNLGISYR